MKLSEAKYDPEVNNEELIRLARQGDDSAKELVFTNNIQLVRKYVTKAKRIGCSIEEEDLLSIGLIGLTKAYNRFNLESGTKFTSYLGACVEQEIIDANKFRKRKNRMKYIHFSLDATVKDSDKEDTYHTFIADEVSNEVYNIKEDEQWYEEVVCSKKFNKRDKEILKYKLKDDLTFDEIGKLYGTSRQAIQQAFKKCTNILLEEKVLVG